MLVLAPVPVVVVVVSANASAFPTAGSGQWSSGHVNRVNAHPRAAERGRDKEQEKPSNMENKTPTNHQAKRSWKTKAGLEENKVCNEASHAKETKQ